MYNCHQKLLILHPKLLRLVTFWIPVALDVVSTIFRSLGSRKSYESVNKKQINMANRKLKIRDLTLRDGQQSLFATRMPQACIDRLLPLYEGANFYIMEVWGSARFGHALS